MIFFIKFQFLGLGGAMRSNECPSSFSIILPQVQQINPKTELSQRNLMTLHKLLVGRRG